MRHSQTSRPRRNHKKRLGLPLPTEVLLQITSYLPKSSWLSLRLVSRSLYSFSSNLPIIEKLWFGPYLEDRTVFMDVCNHPYLSSHVTTILYDITRFEDFSLEELHELWPRRLREGRRLRGPRRKFWLDNHPGIWQYLKLMQDERSTSFDMVQTLAQGLQKLPSVKSIRLAFAFQHRRFKTQRIPMSPLRMYSDIEWVSRTRNPWNVCMDMKDMKNLMEAIIQSGVHIQELDFWQDYISVPLSGIYFEERFDDLSVIFSRLTSLTITISRSSMNDSSDVLSFRKLLAEAKRLKKLHLRLGGPHIGSGDERSENLSMLVDGLGLSPRWTEAPRLDSSRAKYFFYIPWS